MVVKLFGLTLTDVVGALEALTSYFKWSGGQPAGKEHFLLLVCLWISPWRETLKEGLSRNTSYLVQYLLGLCLNTSYLVQYPLTVDLRFRLALLLTVDLRLETCFTIDSYLRLETCCTVDLIQ